MGVSDGRGPDTIGYEELAYWLRNALDAVTSESALLFDQNVSPLLAVHPNDSVTREDMAVMTAGALQALKLAGAEDEALFDRFRDGAAISDNAKGSVATNVKYGLLEGRPGWLMAPGSYATRAEAAIVVDRLSKLQIVLYPVPFQ